MKKFDRRRKYYMILDCETATLPCAASYEGNKKQAVSIAKPLIYDLGWTITDRQGRIYEKKNFLISEVFSVPSIFNTAYYAVKRPLYLEKLKKGEIVLTDWATATAEMVESLQHCAAVGAYNSMFDFKKAIPFTELYINKLYSPDFFKWEKFQNKVCDEIANGQRRESKKDFEPDFFSFRGQKYNLFDLWGLSCSHILDCDEYRQMCCENEWKTQSGKYFKTSAETTYRFIKKDYEFEEEHTALNDAEIETEIFARIVKKHLSNLEMGIAYFPFRILGTVENFESRVSL